MRSIERALLGWILGALALGSVLVALVTYLVTLEEMNEVFDGELKNVAEAVVSYHQANHGGANPVRPALPQRSDAPEDIEIVTLTWTREGALVYASDPRVKLPYVAVEGLSRPQVDGEGWIVYSSVRASGVAQAAQRVASRKEMAGESAAEVFPPMLMLVLIVGGLLVFGLRRGLQPLDSAAKDIALRTATALDPIVASDLPREVAPLVSSINGLMERLHVAFSAQRRFLADTAHELRNPVTALRLQLQLLRGAQTGPQREEALAELDAGVARTQRLIEQLLQAARSEPDGEVLHMEPLDLASLARSVVGDFSTRAEQGDIDLGASAATPQTVLGDREQLTVLLNNLVENALRYTPAGGVVDVVVGLRDKRPELRVIDDGPGIPETQRERVFHRFSRGVDAAAQARDKGGSGLGLAIVRAIAQRHGGSVSLHTPPSGRGLEVRVCFPAA